MSPKKKKARKTTRKAGPVRMKKIPKAVRSKGKGALRSKGRKGKKGELHIAYLSLGSNVGEREEYIEQACFLINKLHGTSITKRSSNFETEAEGVEDQPQFLNAAVELETALSPHKLLDALQEIETTLGRERGAEWGPRTIDLDILLYDDQIVSDDKLQIPHPLLHERLFVIKPLVEIAPDALHPTLETTVSEIYEDMKSEGAETYDDSLPGFKEIKKGAPDDYERW